VSKDFPEVLPLVGAPLAGSNGQRDFLLDESTGLERPDFEGRLHTTAIPPSVITRINKDAQLPPFTKQWYWDSGPLQILSVTHTAWIEYDEHGRNDRSPTVSYTSNSLLARYDFGGLVQGGRLSTQAVARWRNPANGQTGETPPSVETESIRGDNPDKSTVKALLPDTQSKVLAYMESRFRQFDNTGLPLFGPPRGFGVMQIDTPPATARQCWDWKDNIAAGLALYAAKKTEVTNHFNNIYKAHPKAKAKRLKPEQMAQALYQYYNGGFYWDWDDKANDWKTVGTTSYGDEGIRIEKLVVANTPPPEWN